MTKGASQILYYCVLLSICNQVHCVCSKSPKDPMDNTAVWTSNCMAIRCDWLQTIARLIHQLRWQSVVIVFDTATDCYLPDMLRYMHEKNEDVLTTLYNIRSVKDVETEVDNMLRDIYEHLTSYNFLLICQFEVSMTILRLVDEFDARSNRTTDYRHRSKWLITTPRALNSNSRHVSWKMENLALLQVLQPKGRVYIDKESLRIHTLIKHLSGYKFEKVHCTAMPCLSENEIFPNIKYKFNGRHLHVLTKSGIFSYQTQHGDNVTYEGFGVDILRAVAKHLNFSYTISEPADRDWGVLINGSWTGLVGAMAKREADLTIGDLTVHEERSKVMHFLHPAVYMSNIKGLYKKYDVLERNWTSYITIFRSNVYLSIFGVSVLVSILFVVIARSANCPHRGLSESALVVWLDASWFTLAALTKQGVDYHSQGLSGRFMVVSWWIFAIIMSTAYGANLISQLSVHKEQKPFHNLAELIRSEDYSFGMITTGINWMIFQNTKSGSVKQAWSVLRERAKTNPEILDDNPANHFKMVDSGKYCFLAPDYVLEAHQGKDCTLKMMDSPVSWQQLAFGMPKGSPLIEEFERTLFILNQIGFVGNRRKKWFKSRDPEECRSPLSVKPVTVADIQIVFYLLATGTLLSIVSLLSEMAIATNKKRYLLKCK